MSWKGKLLIFDHDGTLHDSMYIFGPAMKAGTDWLKTQGYEDVPSLSEKRISSYLGMNSFDIWKDVAGDIPEKLCLEVAKVVGMEMRRLLQEGHARWYDGTDAALDLLKARGYRMVVLSNCEIRLREIYWSHFNMAQWFDKFYDCESYNFLPKTEIIRIIRQEYDGCDAMVIGDRSSDFECARAVSVPFIGCAYGFGAPGELDGADAVAESPLQIPEKVEQVTERFDR